MSGNESCRGRKTSMNHVNSVEQKGGECSSTQWYQQTIVDVSTKIHPDGTQMSAMKRNMMPSTGT